ncbi:MAG: di-heme oxidoredictase family protein [Caldilineaceae bacterium]
MSAGNRYFITRRLWGVANEPPYFHHGLYTTLRQAVLGHAGEASASRVAYEALSEYEQNALIEFLKSLQVLPPGTPYLYVNEFGEPVAWPPVGLTASSQ